MVVEPTARHAAVLRGLLPDSGTAGNLTADAHLAALVIEHGAELATYDRDFARFSGLRHRLPRPHSHAGKKSRAAVAKEP